MKKDKLIKYIIVNLITFTRILGSIIMPISYFKHGIGRFAFFVCLLFFTDFIDGRLSRYWKVESFLGSLLDTLSDKIFALVMIAILSYEYPIVLLVLFLELAITINSLFAFNMNKNVQSSKLGKVKTFVLDASISVIYIIIAKDLYFSYIPNTIYYFISKYSTNICYVLIGIIVGMQIVTLCDYNKNRFKEIAKFKSLKGMKMKELKEIWYMLSNREFYINNKDKSLKELLYRNEEKI